MSPTVYLSGQITGLTYEEASRWRTDATLLLGPRIRVLNPMQRVSAESFGKPLTAAGAQHIVREDLKAVDESDVILTNLLNATQTSIGTVFELGRASTNHKFIVLVGDPAHHHHDSIFLQYTYLYMARTLEEGCDFTRRVLMVRGHDVFSL